MPVAEFEGAGERTGREVKAKGEEGKEEKGGKEAALPSHFSDANAAYDCRADNKQTHRRR